jgi:D-serine dehydratase
MFERADEPGLMEKVRAAQPCFWANPKTGGFPSDRVEGVDAAEDRLRRAQGLLKALFPVLGDATDPLRSPLLDASRLATRLPPLSLPSGRWWIKADHQLPIAGSIKARGGFHEVIAFAETIALQEGLIEPGRDLAGLASPSCRALFVRYTVVVGSTGNLGMGIGLIASALGFKAVVHMSSDAKAWKKQRLRDHGAIVVEQAGDYAQAVENGRRAAEADPLAHFVDDERSIDLFLGYAAAGRELAQQFADHGLAVDDQHPLFVYIPCGVGGAPGGVTYGLRRLFGRNVHCIFAEPVQSPCMLVQLLSGDEPVSVYDVGLTNRTEADGLAVGQASVLVAPLMRDQVDGIYTVTDDQLFALFRAGHEAMGLTVEPSAAAAFAGPYHVLGTPAGRAYLERAGLLGRLADANHVLWTTGGSLAPEPERQRWLDRAASAPDFDVQAA